MHLPQFMRTFNIHYGAHYNAFHPSKPDPDCLFILHLRHLLSARAQEAAAGSAASRCVMRGLLCMALCMVLCSALSCVC